MQFFKMAKRVCLFLCLSLCLLNTVDSSGILCETGFCRGYDFDVGCTAAASHCSINNATHTGLLLPSPTLCNCCEYCLPFYGEGEHCSTGGPGTGTTVGRCGDGLTCMPDDDGHSYCRRMESVCHKAQDDYDAREVRGELGAMEHRPHCDGKGKYATFDCIPAHTCFCQSEEGERLFGEVLYLGATTTQNMNCGCSRFHEKIRKSIASGVPHPVIGPRCTSEGNFNPVQCIGRTCYCVDRVSGVILDHIEPVDLDEEPISELSCYDTDLDLFPQNEGVPPYNYTTPCFEEQKVMGEFILQSEEEGYNMDYFTSYPECMPDGTYGRIAKTFNGSKICVDERGQHIEGYEVHPNTPEYDSMDCKCAVTSLIMASSTEKPVCCKNGNFRRIQCRRGLCRCVDSDGRQTEKESADVTQLSCYTEDWRNC